MKSKRSYSRATRVAQNILEVAASVLLTEVKDPRISDVQLNEVVLTPDLRIAKIYYVLLGKEEADPDAQAGLASCAGFLRKQLGERLDLRHIPELTFVWDEAVHEGRRIEKILSEIKYSDTTDEDE